MGQEVAAPAQVARQALLDLGVEPGDVEQQVGAAREDLPEGLQVDPPRRLVERDAQVVGVDDPEVDPGPGP
jgi:hypothetical protein